MVKSIKLDNTLHPLYRYVSHLASQQAVDPFGFLDPKINNHYKTLANYREIHHIIDLSKLYLNLLDIASIQKNTLEKTAQLISTINEAKQNTHSLYNSYDLFIFKKLIEQLEKHVKLSQQEQVSIKPEPVSKPRRLFKDGSWNDAVLSNNYELLDDLFPTPDELIADQNTGNTLLLQGIANSQGEFVIKLLDAHDTRHVNKKSSVHENTPLILSVSKGWSHVEPTGRSKTLQSQIAMKLLSKGALVNDVDAHGRTALHYACLHRNIDAISYLIKYKASLNIQDKNGQTPLDFLFYGRDMASNILTQATGGNEGFTFTLKHGAFSPQNDIALIDALELRNLRENIFLQSKFNEKIKNALTPIYKTILQSSKKEHVDMGQLNEIAKISYYQKPEFKELQNAAALYKVYLKLVSVAAHINPDIKNFADASSDFDMKRAQIQSLLDEIKTDPLFKEQSSLINAVADNVTQIQNPQASAAPGLKIFDQSAKQKGSDSKNEKDFGM